MKVFQNSIAAVTAKQLTTWHEGWKSWYFQQSRLFGSEQRNPLHVRRRHQLQSHWLLVCEEIWGNGATRKTTWRCGSKIVRLCLESLVIRQAEAEAETADSDAGKVQAWGLGRQCVPPRSQVRCPRSLHREPGIDASEPSSFSSLLYVSKIKL